MSFYKWSKTAATNASSDPAVNWAEGQAPSSINDSARAEMASNAKWRDDISGTLTTTGSSTAYALTTNQVFSTAALMSGAMITFIPHATSGASPTLAVDGLTARAINKSTGVAVATGQLIIGTPYVVSYIHATTEFVLQGYTEVFGNVTVNGTTLLTGVPTFTAAPVFNGGASLNTGTFSGAATFSGNVIFSGAPNVTGNFAVNTNKFTVASATGNTLAAGTLDATGNFAVNTNKFNVTASSGATAVAGNITGAAAILSSSPTAGIGYSTGAGGTVTQATSKSTGVTLNAASGAITMNNQAIGSGIVLSFILTNSAIAAGDILAINHISGGTAGNYYYNAQCGSGSAGITIRNISAGSLSEAIVLQFAVIKAVNA